MIGTRRQRDGLYVRRMNRIHGRKTIIVTVLDSDRRLIDRNHWKWIHDLIIAAVGNPNGNGSGQRKVVRWSGRADISRNDVYGKCAEDVSVAADIGIAASFDLSVNSLNSS